MLAFWFYYADHEAGQTLAYFAEFGSVLLIAWSIYGGHIDRALLRRVATPLGLWVFGSAFLVFLGLVDGGGGSAIGTSAHRFFRPLPTGNDNPTLLFDRV